MNVKIGKWLAGLAIVFSLLGALPSLAADDIAVSDLPKAVTASIMKRYPGAKIVKAERERDNGKIHYEVNIQTGNKRLELNVRPDGTIYKVEIEDDD